jgi:hypothetical protein
LIIIKNFKMVTTVSRKPQDLSKWPPRWPIHEVTPTYPRTLLSRLLSF